MTELYSTEAYLLRRVGTDEYLAQCGDYYPAQVVMNRPAQFCRRCGERLGPTVLYRMQADAQLEADVIDAQPVEVVHVRVTIEQIE